MPESSRPPRIRNGGKPPSSASMTARIEDSGSMIRRIGRREREASPIRTESKRCPARSPARRRIPVPELPQSRAPDGGESPSSPTPWTMRCETVGSSIATPSERNTAAVARVSSPSRKPVIRDSPSASAASMIARCEMDLSPGTVISPRIGPEGRLVQTTASLKATRPAAAGFPSDADADANRIGEAIAAASGARSRHVRTGGVRAMRHRARDRPARNSSATATARNRARSILRQAIDARPY